MQLPVTLLSSLEGLKDFDRVAFEKVHSSGEQITSVRINPSKLSVVASQLPIDKKVAWAENGFYLSHRPSFTFDPLFHAGTYYVQEASSMFLEQALKQTTDLSKPIKILDLCAAPGGKSTHIQSLISGESILVSNEVIRSRANVLKDNVIKWGCENVIVTNNDPKDFSTMENYFDVIVVDAPCSGSGLFRRDVDAINEWSENNVQLCSQRQQRVLADVWPALKKDGKIIYSTCSYSLEEDEKIMDWMTNHYSTSNCRLELNPEWGISETISVKGNYGYRFWPDKIKGEGFFLACFQKNDGEGDEVFRYKKKPVQATNKDIGMAEDWVIKEGLNFIKHINTVYAWPEQFFKDYSFLLEQLHVIYAGILIGVVMRDKIVPDHALAMSNKVIRDITRTDLNFDQAILYLQRKELEIPIMNKGWQLITYLNSPLGWINSLSNRNNNYYPKSLRILRDI